MSKKTKIEKNLALSADFNEYILRNPDVIAKLPNNVCIVFEVKSDRILSRANLKTAEELHTKEKCFVASKVGARWTVRPLVA